ncbi:sialic acid-binding Ig-like lectin 11 isoform X2 [Protopterus annectens]|uniref:sialic acid-binding Ig-like lectin 11 isoform X2 n=1 Tax=Protopterus annectens TaxID=7888 RepID=UPI001CF9E445|nr:sialic acid-binding Ig-like lectin 11 isoform X2 [Protopterus annectens]
MDRSRYVTVLEGSDVELHCRFQFPNEHKYVNSFWFRYGFKAFCPGGDPDENEVVLYKDRFYLAGNIQDKQCTLGIRNVSSRDAGRYCFRFKTDKNFWSDRWGVYLHVKVIPKSISINIPARLQDGIPAVIICTASDVFPEDMAEIHFCNDIIRGKEVRSYNEDGKFTLNVTVTFIPTLAHHQKVCTCSVTHSYRNRAVQTSATLDVQYEPREVKISVSSNGTIKEEGSVEFNCTADSNPVITGYKWYKVTENGSLHDLNSNSSELHLSSVSRRQRGKYSCQVQNAVGMKDAEALLTVLYPPEIQSPTSCFSSQNNRICRVCVSDANPAANITWLMRTSENRTLVADWQVNGTRSESRVEVEKIPMELFCIATNMYGLQHIIENITKAKNKPDSNGDPVAVIEAEYAEITKLKAPQESKSETANDFKNFEEEGLVYANIAFPQQQTNKQIQDASISMIEYATVTFK